MKVQVNVSDSMVERIDKIAEQLGQTRSATCNWFISQGVLSFEKANSFVSENLASAVATKIFDE